MADKSVWLVTGATSGIGAAVVREVRKRYPEAHVLALDINDTAGADLVAETGADYLHCDVSSLDDWENVVVHLESIGAPTHVHLNAGIQIAPPDAPLSEYTFEAATLENLEKMMGVNVNGVVYGLRALLPLMQSGSAIVVTASLAGVAPYATDPLYAMSKHAVVGLVRSLGGPLDKRGILINALCPGGVATNIIPDEQKTDEAVFMTPEALADEAIWLMGADENGRTWAKVAEDKPVFVVRAPGDKGGRHSRE